MIKSERTQLPTRQRQTARCRPRRKKGTATSRHDHYFSHSLLVHTMRAAFKKTRQGIKKKEKKRKSKEHQHVPKREQSSEPDSDMRQLLELSASKFKITIISMLKALTEKVGHMKDQMGIPAERWKV